jgi:hypothetical protein
MKYAVFWDIKIQFVPHRRHITFPLVPLCPLQNPLDLTRARTQAAAVGSRRLTAPAMEMPDEIISAVLICLHDDLNVTFIKNVIQEKSINHHDRLGNHSNPIL